MLDSMSMHSFDIPSKFENPRKNLWQNVLSKSISTNFCVEELEKLKRLAGGEIWMDMVPFEWKEIYGALYDEAQSFNIDDTEKCKIDKDVHRTFGLFTRHIPSARVRLKVRMNDYYDALHKILMAASHERGYCQGINFLAAAFLLSVENERDSFTILCFLLRHCHVGILLNSKCSSLVEYMKVFEKRLRQHNKDVYNYFKAIGFGPVCYAIEWFTTCFVVTCPGDISSCVIDLLLLGFDDIMIRVGLAIVDILSDDILSMTLEDLQTSFKQMVTSVDPLAVFSKALAIKFQPKENNLETMATNIELMSPDGEMVDTLRHHRYRLACEDSASDDGCPDHLRERNSPDNDRSIGGGILSPARKSTNSIFTWHPSASPQCAMHGLSFSGDDEWSYKGDRMAKRIHQGEARRAEERRGRGRRQCRRLENSVGVDAQQASPTVLTGPPGRYQLQPLVATAGLSSLVGSMNARPSGSGAVETAKLSAVVPADAAKAVPSSKGGFFSSLWRGGSGSGHGTLTGSGSGSGGGSGHSSPNAASKVIIGNSGAVGQEVHADIATTSKKSHVTGAGPTSGGNLDTTSPRDHYAQPIEGGVGRGAGGDASGGGGGVLRPRVGRRMYSRRGPIVANLPALPFTVRNKSVHVGSEESEEGELVEPTVAETFLSFWGGVFTGLDQVGSRYYYTASNSYQISREPANRSSVGGHMGGFGSTLGMGMGLGMGLGAVKPSLSKGAESDQTLGMNMEIELKKERRGRWQRLIRRQRRARKKEDMERAAAAAAASMQSSESKIGDANTEEINDAVVGLAGLRGIVGYSAPTTKNRKAKKSVAARLGADLFHSPPPSSASMGSLQKFGTLSTRNTFTPQKDTSTPDYFRSRGDGGLRGQKLPTGREVSVLSPAHAAGSVSGGVDNSAPSSPLLSLCPPGSRTREGCDAAAYVGVCDPGVRRDSNELGGGSSSGRASGVDASAVNTDAPTDSGTHGKNKRGWVRRRSSYLSGSRDDAPFVPGDDSQASPAGECDAERNVTGSISASSRSGNSSRVVSTSPRSPFGGGDAHISSIKPTLTNASWQGFVCAINSDTTSKDAKEQIQEAKEEIERLRRERQRRENERHLWVANAFSNFLHTSLWVGSLGLLGKDDRGCPFPEESSDNDSVKSLKKFNGKAVKQKKDRDKARSRARAAAHAATGKSKSTCDEDGDSDYVRSMIFTTNTSTSTSMPHLPQLNSSTRLEQRLRVGVADVNIPVRPARESVSGSSPAARESVSGSSPAARESVSGPGAALEGHTRCALNLPGGIADYGDQSLPVLAAIGSDLGNGGGGGGGAATIFLATAEDNDDINSPRVEASAI